MNTHVGNERLVTLEAEVEHLREEVKELRADIKALLEAWSAATGLVKFVKLLATVIAAFSAIYVLVTHGKAG